MRSTMLCRKWKSEKIHCMSSLCKHARWICSTTLHNIQVRQVPSILPGRRHGRARLRRASPACAACAAWPQGSPPGKALCTSWKAAQLCKIP